MLFQFQVCYVNFKISTKMELFPTLYTEQVFQLGESPADHSGSH